MKPIFQLVGKCDDSNPSSIPIEMIKQWEQEGLITYLGESQDIRPVIAQSSCVILPSYSEGVPRILLEAMSMEKPIITTNVSGCRECILLPKRNGEIYLGKNGIMIEAKNHSLLAYAIKHFLSLSQDKQKQMGKIGRKYAIERFDVSKTIQIYKEKASFYAKQGKILVFIGNTSFGMSNFRLDILQALKHEGYDIHIISPQDNSTQILLENNFIFHPIKINSKGLNPLEDLNTLFSIYKILRSIRPSLVFNYTIKPIIYGAFACNILSIPNIAVTTGLGYAFIQGGIKKQILKKFICLLYKIALFKTQEVWFLNDDDRTTFLKSHILKRQKILLLDGEGINTSYFFPRDCQNKEVVFTLAARTLWDKGIQEFIEAIKILKGLQ